MSSYFTSLPLPLETVSSSDVEPRSAFAANIRCFDARDLDPAIVSTFDIKDKAHSSL